MGMCYTCNTRGQREGVHHKFPLCLQLGIWLRVEPTKPSSCQGLLQFNTNTALIRILCTALEKVKWNRDRDYVNIADSNNVM